MRKPLAIDLFCGLGGWTEGLLAEGYDVLGFDIEQHVYGDDCYPGMLAVQDVLTLHGSQFKNADLIVASPPCQEYSYMAMPWSLAKAKAAAIRADDTGLAFERLNRLFNACFRIQREACAAAGRHVPMVVENVRGAQPWMGRAAWNYGSYYLWGDVPALMPPIMGGGGRARQKSHPGEQWNVNRANFTGTLGWDQAERGDDGLKNPGFRFDGSGRSFQSESVNRHVAPNEGFKSKGMDWSNRNLRGQDFTRIAGAQAQAAEGRKGAGAGAGAAWFDQNLCVLSSKSSARKAASAKIAKIPFTLSSWIARCYLPERVAA